MRIIIAVLFLFLVSCDGGDERELRGAGWRVGALVDGVLTAGPIVSTLEACLESREAFLAGLRPGAEVVGPGCLPPSRCAAIKETVEYASGIMLRDEAVNLAYGEAICP